MSEVITPQQLTSPASAGGKAEGTRPLGPRRTRPAASRTWRGRLLRWLAGACHDGWGLYGPPAAGILMYHRITDEIPGLPRPTWNVPPRRLAAQLEGLLVRGWQAWPLERVLEHHQRGLAIPRRTFVVTFDDGYANNLYQALPILQRLGVPATVFLATAYLDSPGPFPFDDWEAAGTPRVMSEAWRPLTTAECRQLLASGLVRLGAHTHTHADFRGQPERLRRDLAQCQAVLRDLFFIESPPLALPYGTPEDGFAAAELIAAAREAGVSCCLTTEPERIGPQQSPFGWGRRGVEAEDTAATLAGWLSGWENVLRQKAAAAGRGALRWLGSAAPSRSSASVSTQKESLRHPPPQEPPA